MKTLGLTDAQARALCTLMDRDGNYDYVGKNNGDVDPEVFWELYDAVKQQLEVVA